MPVNFACYSFYLSWLSYSYKLVKMLSAYLDVNHSGTNHNYCADLLMNPVHSPKNRPI